jgi:hypothetical protein
MRSNCSLLQQAGSTNVGIQPLALPFGVQGLRAFAEK